jgi:hypothetical protein
VPNDIEAGPTVSALAALGKHDSFASQPPRAHQRRFEFVEAFYNTTRGHSTLA